MAFFVFILALLAVGVGLKRIGLGQDFAKSLNLFIIYVSLPATVLLLMPKVSFTSSALAVILTPWLLLPISVALVWWLTRHQPTEVRAALLLVVPLGNTSFLGIPMVTALLGAEAVPFALIYDQLGSFLILAIYGTVVVSYYQTGQFDWSAIGKKIVTFPPAIALCAALIWGEMPEFVIPYLQRLADTLVPLALVSVGYSLTGLAGLRDRLFVQAVSIKLLLMPLIVFLLLSPWQIDPLAMQAAVLSSAMPAMITAGALAIAAGFAPALSAALVGYGMILSLLTLPLIRYLLSMSG